MAWQNVVSWFFVLVIIILIRVTNCNLHNNRICFRDQDVVMTWKLRITNISCVCVCVWVWVWVWVCVCVCVCGGGGGGGGAITCHSLIGWINCWKNSRVLGDLDVMTLMWRRCNELHMSLQHIQPTLSGFAVWQYCGQWWRHETETFPRYWPFVRGIHRSRCIPRTKASDAELWCFIWSAPE